ncbi:MAG: hypothetical protein O9327_02555 [Polaromonas sp.]|nr:hypothetical protein [Polaromonas sp.]
MNAPIATPALPVSITLSLTPALLSAPGRLNISSQWRELVGEQGWNDESQRIHLEGFLEQSGLMPLFLAYAKKAAAEEVASAASLDEQDHECALEVAEHVHSLGRVYGFQQDEDSVGDAINESALQLNIDLDEDEHRWACDKVLRLQEAATASRAESIEMTSQDEMPGTAHLLGNVMLSDVVGPYEDAVDLPDWAWLQARASYVTKAADAPSEIVLNLANGLEGAPARWVPVVDAARQMGLAYLLIHHGT